MKILATSLIGLFISSSFQCKTNENTIASNSISINSTSNGFAVIELFTSEGCSSCPPADALVSRLSSEIKENVYVLSYHVDYWDRLGWKDKHSSHLWTQRQQDYATHFSLNGAYTPQIVVNGNEEFVGSSASKLYAAVNKNLKKDINKNDLTINAKATANNIIVSYTAPQLNDNKVCFALVQLQSSSKVTNGENEGRTLPHINIVQDFKAISTTNNNKETSFIIPSNFNTNEYKVIAFLQNGNNYNITAATSCIIEK